MQPCVSLVSALTAIIIFGLVFCHVILGTERQIKCHQSSKNDTAYLTCEIPSSMDIVQVTWQKRRGNSYDTLVTNSKRFGAKISKPYENRLSVLKTEHPGTSTITLSELEKEDGVCFMAIFNIYPDGALKEEVCLPKLHGVNEVVCKSSADFSVTLKPPEIKTQHSEPDGSVIQIGRWVNNKNIFPVCNFQLRRTERAKRNVQDRDEIFSIECNSLGPRKPTITWNNEGRPISIEEKVNTTGDLILVTSTLHHSLATLPEGSEISCDIVYNKENHASIRVEEKENDASYRVEEKDLQNENLSFVRLILPSLAFIVVVLFCIAYFLIYRRQSKSANKIDNIEKGALTPLTKSPHNTIGTPGTNTKKRKESAMKKNKENSQWENDESSYIPNSYEKMTPHKLNGDVGTPGSEIKKRKRSSVKKSKENVPNTNNEGDVGTPGSEIKKRKRSSVKKSKENVPNTNNEVAGKTPNSATKLNNSSQQEARKKSAKKLHFK
ncbi:uncharacterized protein LOC142281528 isoform X1 [Anomaloglossus baeobatrachus]|uniref:uncharacterized protein LOC142281528 isoform X1 n=1 Tax=Anomaloglossus baeobatrachus TaxID=238106 RepID=UPI003F4FF513